MTKGELIELLKNVPDESQIDVYDVRDFTHPNFKVNTSACFDYDKGIPIVTLEVGE